MKKIYYLLYAFFCVRFFSLHATSLVLDDQFGPTLSGVSTTATVSGLGQQVFANAMAVDSSNRIVVTGYSDNNLLVGRFTTSSSPAPARNGIPDSTFGTGGFTLVSGGSSSYKMYGVTLDSTPNIIVCGVNILSSGARNPVIARFLSSDGSLSVINNGNAFGFSTITTFYGVVVTAGATGPLYTVGVSVGSGFPQPRLIVVSYQSTLSNTLNTTFGGTGFVQDSGTFGTRSIGNAIALVPGGTFAGKIVVAGQGTIGGTGVPQMLIAQYDTSGNLDSAFNGQGFVLTSVSGVNNATVLGINTTANDATNGNKPVIAGAANGNIVVVRYTTTGSLDTANFNSGGTTPGTVTTQLGQAVSVSGLTFDGSNIVVSGNADGYTYVVRYLSNGTLDTSFGTGGIAKASACGENQPDFTKGLGLQTYNSVIGYIMAGGCENTLMTERILRAGNFPSTANVNSFTDMALPRMGDSAFVDSVFGNNTTGQINGGSFKTITAALSAASSYFTATGLPVTVWVYPGTYNEQVVIPSNVSVKGVTQGPLIGTGSGTPQVLIQLAGVGATISLVVMAANTSIEDVSLNLTTSTAAAALAGIAFQTSSLNTAAVRRVMVNVDNSGAGAGAAACQGIVGIGSGTAGTIDNVVDSTILVTTASTGNTAAGIMIGQGSVVTMNVRDCKITATGGTQSIGAQSGTAGDQLFLRGCTVSGGLADISQTAGTISLEGTDLVHFTSNGLGFTDLRSPKTIQFHANNALTAAATTIMPVGTAATVTTANEAQAQIRFSQPCLVRAISVHTATSAADPSTYTVRLGGVATAVTVTLGAGATSATSTANAATFATGTLLSVSVTTGATVPTDPNVTIEMY